MNVRDLEEALSHFDKDLEVITGGADGDREIVSAEVYEDGPAKIVILNLGDEV